MRDPFHDEFSSADICLLSSIGFAIWCLLLIPLTGTLASRPHRLGLSLGFASFGFIAFVLALRFWDLSSLTIEFVGTSYNYNLNLLRTLPPALNNEENANMVRSHGNYLMEIMHHPSE
jgi:hypothetical protein